MKFTLIVCTYQRPGPLLTLLGSVVKQSLFPYQILIIDGSKNDETRKELEVNSFKNLEYFKVGENNRGLTKQRNFGIERVDTSSEIVCFLDDDIVITPTYFQNLW